MLTPVYQFTKTRREASEIMNVGMLEYFDILRALCGIELDAQQTKPTQR